MNVQFLQELFTRLGGGVGQPLDPGGQGGACSGTLSQAVEHVVDQVSGRLRAMPRYGRILSGPVASCLTHIDAMVEGVPGTLLCSRTSFNEDPRVNAFFVNPLHLQEVFSRSEEVRELFDAEPIAQECCALLCMRMDERRQLGIGMEGDRMRRDVLQTAVSFTDHQVVSPGSGEADARRALKCCIFNGLLDHIRRSASAAKGTTDDLERRLQALRGRQRHLNGGASNDTQAAELQGEIDDVARQLGGQAVRLSTLDDHLRFVAEALDNPSAYLSARTFRLRISRLGIRLDEESLEPGYELLLSEMRVSSQGPRVSALVRFPREELLPRPDILANARHFLNP